MEVCREEMRVMGMGIGMGCIGSSSMEEWGVASSCGGLLLLGGGTPPPAWLLYPDDDEDPQLPESVGRGGSGGFVGVLGSSGLGRGAVSDAIVATGGALLASVGASR